MPNYVLNCLESSKVIKYSHVFIFKHNLCHTEQLARQTERNILH